MLSGLILVSHGVSKVKITCIRCKLFISANRVETHVGPHLFAFVFSRFQKQKVNQQKKGPAASGRKVLEQKSTGGWGGGGEGRLVTWL